MIALDFALTALLTLTTDSGYRQVQQRDSQQESTKSRQEVLATFQVGGQKRTLSRDDVALHLARRYRNGADGKAAVDHIIEVHLVRTAATAAGLMPTDDEVRSQIHAIESALKQRKMDLEKVLKQQRISRRDFVAATALSLAQKRLTGKVLGVAPDRVTQRQTALWTKEERNKIEIITDQSKLPSGVLAKIGDTGEVTNLDVGRILFSKVSKAQLEEAVNVLVFQECIDHEARQRGIEITESELEHQFAKRKQAFESSGRGQGIHYEQWLAAFGSSKANELNSKSLLTTLRHDKLVRHQYPTAKLDAEIATQREALLRRHGARRSMSLLFVRATDRPNKLLRRNFASALEQIQALRKEIVDKNRSFALMAKTASDDPRTKTNGGKIGWQQREYLPGSGDQRAPDEVLEAAFQLEVSAVSQPIRTAQGYYLVWVSGLEPEPEPSTLRARLLGEKAQMYNRELFAAAKIELMVDE